MKRDKQSKQQSKQEYPGVFYHVMNRGLPQATIFDDDRNRRQLLNRQGRTANLLGCHRDRIQIFNFVG